jgi:hypothetical protein
VKLKGCLAPSQTENEGASTFSSTAIYNQIPVGKYISANSPIPPLLSKLESCHLLERVRENTVTHPQKYAAVLDCIEKVHSKRRVQERNKVLAELPAGYPKLRKQALSNLESPSCFSPTEEAFADAFSAKLFSEISADKISQRQMTDADVRAALVGWATLACAEKKREVSIESLFAYDSAEDRLQTRMNDKATLYKFGCESVERSKSLCALEQSPSQKSSDNSIHHSQAPR